MMRIGRGKLRLMLLLTGVLGIVSIAYAVPGDLRRTTIHNQTAYIPSQCYTKTQDDDNKARVYNPCYVCHTRSIQPNYINDFDLQQEYSLPAPALQNPWTNLFEDRSQRIQAISDTEMQIYLDQNNYLGASGEPKLAAKLDNLPEEWDYNGNARWDGYQPDCYFNFDEQGFDIRPDGSESGWRAFAYYPFPGTFWPTNGSTDDVLIRLADSFRQDAAGNYDREVYRLNLAIVEAVVKGRDLLIDPVNETTYGVDLNKDGQLGRADRVVFDWEPRQGRLMSYVGLAGVEQKQGVVHLAQGLFPEGTEFLHSVRYLDPSSDEVQLSARMKELRYMKKRHWQTYADLEEGALAEAKERDDFPDRISHFIGNAEQGLNNGTGWLLQGFIEDAQGELRPQTYEETVYCLGCHGGVGATTDSVYAFSRKLDGQHHRRGWYHWNQKGFAGLPEPKIEIAGSGVYYEYTYYLMYNRSGNEFRDNQEVIQKFYNPDGSLREDRIADLHKDISLLLNPSDERAMRLNKAYRTIVEDQDFVAGRDANIKPLVKVYEGVEQNHPTGVKQASSTAAFGSRFGPQCRNAQSGKRVSPLLSGQGMSGPSGIPYEADWQGIIDKSRYAIDIPGLHFTFPERLTLPTREIVPVAGGSTCYSCHRLDYPAASKGNPGQAMINTAQLPGRTDPPAGTTRLTRSPGRDTQAVPGPNGGLIAFVSDRSGTDQVWLMAPDGSSQRQLTRGPDSHAWPQWSPNGKQLVVWSEQAGSGRQVIKLVSIAEGREQQLVKGPERLDRPTFHPDGEVIAYAAQREGNWDIWLYQLEDQRSVRMTMDPQMETNPLWSQDGYLLSYKVAPTAGVYNLTGQNVISFAAGLDSPEVYQWDGPQSVQMNSWAPDGQQITYTAEVISNASGEERVSYAAIVSDLRLEDGQASADKDRLLAGGCTLGDRGPVFSPDGRWIAFWGWNSDATASLWLYDVAEEKARRLTSGGVDMYPQWSRDGRRLIFESNVDGQIDLLSINLAPATIMAAMDD